MKFVSIWKPDAQTWAADPDEKQMAAMGELIGELMSAGVLLDTGGVSDGGSSLRVQRSGGKFAVTDGPYAETKEQLGGIQVLEARDLNHAIQLISQHPAVKYGTPFEILPAGDMSEMVRESERRRGKDTALAIPR